VAAKNATKELDLTNASADVFEEMEQKRDCKECIYNVSVKISSKYVAVIEHL
jgi:hypothetical protein